MLSGSSGHRPTLDRTSVPWLTIGLLSILIAYADGFWLTSLEGAIGAIERTQDPFHSWLRNSTILLPVFILIVLAAVRCARRLIAPTLRGPGPLVVTGLLIAAACTVFGTVAIAANTAYDYHLQSQQLTVIHAAHAGEPSGHHHAGRVPAPNCDLICQDRRAMREVDARAVGYAAGVLAVTNLLLVGWVIAIRGGRLVSQRV
jgi:hypothetical protein